MKDLLIIGSGPAGISAALTAKRRNLDFAWFGNKSLSSKVINVHRVANYPGLTDVTGEEMYNAFKHQIKHEGLEIIEKKVNNIIKVGDKYMVSAGSDVYEGKAIILAIGVDNGKGIEGESGFVGRGVSYCATCDGMFYKDKEIAVICTNKDYEEEIEFLMGIASKIHLFVSYDTEIQADNVIVYKNKPLGIKGGLKADTLVYDDGGEAEVSVDGIFLLRDTISPKTLLPGLDMDEGHIIVNRMQETNLEGVFAAGDCTGRPYQYAKAVGEGNVAIYSVTGFLARSKNAEKKDI